MQIFVDDAAVKWIEEEFRAPEGDSVRILAKYGHSAMQPGFNLTLSAELARDVVAEYNQNGVHVFIKEEDAWYFNEEDVYMHYDPARDELFFDIGQQHE